MRHLGTEPHWVSISGKVDFPEDVRKRYNEIMEPAVAAFQSDFARRLANDDLYIQNIVVQPKGLRNEKLMCFANASMQLLFASPYFVSLAHFMRVNLSLFSPRQRELTPTWQAFCNFLSGFQFSDSASPDGALPSLQAVSLSTVGFATSLTCLDPVFGPFRSTRKPLTQEDASQFLMFFLNALHEEQLKLMKLLPEDDDSAGQWKVQGTKRGLVPLQETQGEMSPVRSVFSTLVRADTMQNGRSRSVSTESFLVLLLEIRGCKTLEEAIQAFTREERIDGQVSKKNSYVQLPKSLIIGLNRFGFDMYTAEPVKLSDVVNYPEVLTMEAPLSGTKQYQLSAVVEHKGDTPTGGHYVCWARRFDGTWMLFDDDHVQKVSNDAHLGHQAYLLLYNQITA